MSDDEKSEISNTPKDLLKPKKDKRGVVYMQVIPPHMSSEVIRKMLTQRFEVGRIYLQPEDPGMTRQRLKMNKKASRNIKFTEGWIEFERKKDAKLAALALNNQLMGGKKRKNKFHDDRWNLRYLKGFKWANLTEKLVYDQKMREQRLKTDMSRANKELQYYQEKAEMAISLNKMEERRKAKLQKLEEDPDLDEDDSEAEAKGEVNEKDAAIKKKKLKNFEKQVKYSQRKRRDFKQREPIPIELTEAAGPSKRKKSE